MKPKFTIFTPPYTDKSAGIWLLHFLCHSLNNLGYQSSLVCFDLNNIWTNPEFKTPLAYQHDSIVIYPEIISGNPLGAEKVVRYLLNNEGFFTGKKIEWGRNDFPLSFSAMYRNDCDILFYPIANLDLFYDAGRQRNGYCLYKGKNIYRGPMPHFECLEITRAWPQTKRELAEIFRSKLFLFSCDSYTSTCLDAALCGCIPILLKPAHEAGELGKFWANDFSEIHVVLQNMAALPSIIRNYQRSFYERLDEIVVKIVHHFGSVARNSTIFLSGHNQSDCQLPRPV
jgi:O-antigen biosynthesis protein